jgi:hypothetical protein
MKRYTDPITTQTTYNFKFSSMQMATDGNVGRLRQENTYDPDVRQTFRD